MVFDLIYERCGITRSIAALLWDTGSARQRPEQEPTAPFTAKRAVVGGVGEGRLDQL